MAGDDERGGRLFDSWRSEANPRQFEPDAKGTAGVPDGKGGPRGDGTLLFADGRPLLNDEGHDYRFKNLFGWDLRGPAGIYGPAQQNKKSLLGVDLLAWPGDATALADRLEKGDAQIPAFGPVMERSDLEALASFVVAVRDGKLPRPDQLFRLTSPAQQNYALVEGASAERGKQLYAQRCTGCHGADGTRMLFDKGAYSLGSHARQKAYEDWAKILNGHPGSAMKRQVRGATGKEMTQELLDLLAALCDRSAFPRGTASQPDVPDGDPRCGGYLR
jgi:mono/diheme cytochrome c family protein